LSQIVGGDADATQDYFVGGDADATNGLVASASPPTICDF